MRLAPGNLILYLKLGENTMRKLMPILAMTWLASCFAQTPQNLHLNKIVAKLERGQLVLGMWVSALHPSNAIGLVEMNGYPTFEESMSKPMIDYTLIDMEHEPYDISTLRNFLLALNSKREVLVKGNLQPNIAVLVRFPAEGNQPVHAMIKQVLDVGVHGVVVPHVRNAAEAEKIVQACRYPQPKGSSLEQPQGTRGASPWLCSFLWGLSMDEYVQRADVWPLNPHGDLLAVVMIEDEEGVKNIGEILKVKGIGAVIFGPYDFSFACGHPGQANHPEVLQKWQEVKQACDLTQVPLVGFASPENIKQKLTEGYKMLLFGHDVANNETIPKILEAVRSR